MGQGKVQTKKIGGSRFILDGEAEKSQLDRIEKKVDDLLHETRRQAKSE
jgi:hypothetical protein